VLGRSRWWFGEVSNNFELDRDRYGGDFMHDAILGLLASLILHQAMACIDGLDGCDLVRLIILPIWKILFGNRQDHQKVKCEDYLRQDFENLKMNH
jgi:hypothetical protein